MQADARPVPHEQSPVSPERVCYTDPISSQFQLQITSQPSPPTPFDRVTYFKGERCYVTNKHIAYKTSTSWFLKYLYSKKSTQHERQGTTRICHLEYFSNGLSCGVRLLGFESWVDTEHFYYLLWPSPCLGRHFKPLVPTVSVRMGVTLAVQNSPRRNIILSFYIVLLCIT